MNPTDLPTYFIRVRGRIPSIWKDAFNDLSISEEQDACGVVTCLTGQFQDQAAMQGMLNNLHSLGLTLIGLQTQNDYPPD